MQRGAAGSLSVECSVLGGLVDTSRVPWVQYSAADFCPRGVWPSVGCVHTENLNSRFAGLHLTNSLKKKKVRYKIIY